MMAPCSLSARSSAYADLPLAVGPAIRIAFRTGSPRPTSAETAMSFIATLMSDPAKADLTSALADTAMRSVDATGLTWLADRIACDLVLPEDADPCDAEARLRRGLAGKAIDIVVQKSHDRKKRVLIADMDSTMIGQECIDELADEAGFGDRVSQITARAMNGEIAFEPALRERVALLSGLPVSIIDKVVATRITLTKGGPELVRTMKHYGGHTALVSGGFTAFTSRVAGLIGFDEHRANELHQRDGALTGEVGEPILGRAAKVEALDEITARLGLGPEDAIAVGDGANDLAMIARAGTGVALHAKPVVAEEADFRIDHGDLTALLYIQGYMRSEFVT